MSFPNTSLTKRLKKHTISNIYDRKTQNQKHKREEISDAKNRNM